MGGNGSGRRAENRSGELRVTIDPEVHAAAHAQAKADGRELRWVVERLLAAYVAAGDPFLLDARAVGGARSGVNEQADLRSAASAAGGSSTRNG